MDVNSFIQSAMEEKWQENYQRAIEILTNGIAEFPDDALLRRYRSDCFVEIRAYREAIDDLTYVMEVLGSTGILKHMERARFYAELREFDKAIEDINQAISYVDPYRKSQLVDLAECYERRGSYFQAKGLYLNALSDYSTSISFASISFRGQNEIAFRGRAEVSWELGEIFLAWMDIQKVAEYYPLIVQSSIYIAIKQKIDAIHQANKEEE